MKINIPFKYARYMRRNGGGGRCTPFFLLAKNKCNKNIYKYKINTYNKHK